MTQIPDEAVQAAVKAYSKQMDYNDNHDDAVKAALIAALPNLTLDFDVKKLEWAERPRTVDGRRQWQSDDREVISETCPEWDTLQGFRLFFAMSTYPTLEEAKDAAQADFERRVRECVVAKPVDVAAVRRQAFEKAKALAFDTSESVQYMGNGDCGENSIYQQGAREVYDTICDHIESALSAEPEQGDHIADVGKMVEADKWQPTHRHVKRGTEYQKLGDAQVQCEDGLTDYELATVYVGSDGEIWVRRKSEFEDGRFVPLPAATTPEAGRATLKG